MSSFDTSPNQEQLPPAILLLGPTASGKTAAAVELIRHLPCEIISVDSALVYRYMNIGTAKPDMEMLAQAPHRLIDIRNPDETYSAAQFREDALREMADISARGKIPLLVGGTMLYFKALREGLSQLPEADALVREEIDERANRLGWAALHAELATIDPLIAARLNPADAQRIQRALEVYYLTGKPMSTLQGGNKSELPYRLISIALEPSDRKVLHERIAQRFDNMIADGLIDEVRMLRETFTLTSTMPSMRCVGYRQTWQYLDGEFGLDELRDKGVAATRQLAKRQLTWLRTMDVVRFDCLNQDLTHHVLAYVRNALA